MERWGISRRGRELEGIVDEGGDFVLTILLSIYQGGGDLGS